MEIGNMSKRQKSYQRADNSRRPPVGLQRSGKIPPLKVVLSWPLNKNVYYFSDIRRHINLQNI